MDSPLATPPGQRRVRRLVSSCHRSTWCIYVAILGITVGAFLPSLRVLHTPEFLRHYGDVLCAGQPPTLRMVRAETVRFGKLRPVASVIHLGLLATCKDHTLAYKSIHLVLFSLTGIALFRVVCAWDRRSVAFFTAVLFFFYPPRLSPESLVHVMTLERHLAMGLLLASYLAWRRGCAQSAHGWIALGTALFLLALLSKESVLLLPLAFPLMGRFLERHPKGSLRGYAVRIIPLIIVSVAWGVTRLSLAHALRYGLSKTGTSLEPSHVLGAMRDSGRLMVGIPLRLPGSWLSYAAWFAVVLLLMCHRTWSIRVTGMCWVGLALAPHLHLLHQGQNYAYFALPLLCFSMVRAIDMLVALPGRRATPRWCVWGVLLGALTVHAHLTTRAVAAPLAALEDIREWLQDQPPCAQPSLRVALAGVTSELVKGKGATVLRCGTGLRPNQIEVRVWEGTAVPHGAVSGESMGIGWWAWRYCLD